MADEVLVALSVQRETLVVHVVLGVVLSVPLRLKHLALALSQFSILLTLNFSGVSLPVTDSHHVSNVCALLLSLLLLTLVLLLCIEVRELSVDLFLVHLCLELTSLVNELLLTLNLCAVGVENTVLFAQLISGGLEALVHAAINFSLAFSFTFAPQVLHTLKHLFTNLLRCLQILLEFYRVLLLFGSQESSKLLLAPFKVRGLT